MHVFAGNKMCIYYYFLSREPAKHWICDQWIADAMPGSCKLFQFSVDSECSDEGGGSFAQGYMLIL